MFFKKKDEQNQTILNKKTRFSKKCLNIIFACFISLCVLGGAATSIYFSTLNNNLSGQYGKEYKATIQSPNLTSSNNWYEDPTKPNDTTPDFGEIDANQMLNAYSNYLLSRNINDFDIHSKYDTTDATNPNITINATLPNIKYHDSERDEDNSAKKRDQSPINIYLNDVSSSRICLLFAPHGDDQSSTLPNPSILCPEDYIQNDTKDNIQKGKDNKHIYVKFNKTNQNIGQSIYDKLKKDDSSSTDKHSEVYVINDINSLINVMVKDAEAYYYHQNNTFTDYPDLKKIVDEAYYGLSSSEKNFAKDFVNWSNWTATGQITFGDPVTFCNFLDISNTRTVDADKFPFANFFNWIDGDQSNPSYDSWTFNGKIKYDFMKKYIVDIITSNTLSTFIPDKDPTKNNKSVKDDSYNHDWLSLNNDNQTTSNIYNSYKKYKFNLPVQNIGKSGIINPTTQSELGILGIINQNLIVSQKQEFKNNLFGISPLWASIISLCALIILIGVVVSILYRIPWMLGMVNIFGVLTLTFFFMMLGGYAISFGILCGLLVVFLSSLIVIYLFMERIKKFVNEGNNLKMGIKKGIRNTIFQAIDIYAINLISSLCFIYLGRLDINALGMTIAIGTLISICLVLGLWLLTIHISFPDGKKTFLFFKKKKKLQYEQLTLNNHKYESTLFNLKQKFNFNFFNIKLISVTLFFILIILLAFVLLITKTINPFTSFSNSATKEFGLNCLYMWMIIIPALSVYSLIRLNWSTFLPTLLLLTLLVSLPFLALVLFQIPISLNTLVGLSAISLLSTQLLIIFIGNTYNQWIKTHIMKKHLLKQAINKEMNNGLNLYMLLFTSYLLAFLTLIIFSSETLIWVYLSTLISLLFSYMIIFLIGQYLCLWCLLLRYKYFLSNIKKRFDGSYERINYDLIDEQEIELLNKFKKNRVTNI